MRMAHTLKGVAGNIGAKGIQKAAGALEQACKTGADQEQLETLLSMVETALAPVLESLKQIQPEQEQTQASPQAVNPEEQPFQGDNPLKYGKKQNPTVRKQ